MDRRLGRSLTLRRPSCHRVVKRQARLSQEAGPRPIWSGYAAVENYPRSTAGDRTSNDVRTDADIGAFYTWLVTQRAPTAIVEFGTAFGVSGMYWLGGLEEIAAGHLFTFEPNANWAEIADANLQAVSGRYTLTLGTFEANAKRVLGNAAVDLALVDAIHTSEFVFTQFEVLSKFLAPGAIVLFDDINFSDDMRACWNAISRRPNVAASATVGGRVGMIELQAA